MGSSSYGVPMVRVTYSKQKLGGPIPALWEQRKYSSTTRPQVFNEVSLRRTAHSVVVLRFLFEQKTVAHQSVTTKSEDELLQNFKIASHTKNEDDDA